MANDNLPTKPKFELMALSAHDLFAKVAGEEIWMKEIGFALQILRGSEYLQKVANTPAGAESIKNAVANLALCGTTLNPALKKAYLVPRKVNGVMLCCLDMSYIGLAGIAMDSGSVKHIAPRLVYSFDKFDYYELDGEPRVRHTQELNPPKEFCENPAKFWDYLVCGYTVTTLHDGHKIITQPLPKWKLEKAMKTSMTTSEKTPWRTFPDEMCLKTLVKHAYKLLPQTDRMSQAVSILNEHEGLDQDKAVGMTNGSRAKDVVSRFMDADDAVITTVSGETVDTSTGEVTEDQPRLCPVCQKLVIEGRCMNTACTEYEPTDADLFGKK